MKERYTKLLGSAFTIYMKQIPTTTPTLKIIAQSVEQLQHTANTTQASVQDLLTAMHEVKVETKQVKTELKTDIKALKDEADELARSVKVGFDDVDKRFTNIETEITGMKSDINQMKSVMVTKDYLDEKLFNLRGDLTALTRKEDRKLTSVVTLLEKKKVFTPKEASAILHMEPFTS